MTIFDVAILLILFLFAIRGFISGMISQVISVGSYIISWLVSSRFYFLLSPYIPAEIPWNNIGAMIILFIVTIIVIRFVHSAIKKFVNKFHLAKYDRVLGLTLGIVKGLLICMIITFFAAMLTEKSRQLVLESKSGKMISQLIVKVGVIIPDESCKMLKTQIELFNEQVEGQFVERENDNLQLPEISLDTVFDNVQNIRNNIESKIENSKEAVSLIDGIYKWWNKWKNNSNDTESENENENEKDDKNKDELKPKSESESSKISSISNAINNNGVNSILDSVKEIVRDNVTDQISDDVDSEQRLFIPTDRRIFRLTNSPVLPSEIIRSQSTPNNKASAKLFEQ
ncbi:MAG: CvpA family protein [Planctomycetaceae bacterium]|jgi:membrane protein required for colicin V production|nr:CvpA family protein [Planctomycetaceae bacterium]